MKRFKKFFSLKISEKVFVIKSLFYLLIFKTLINILPFSVFKKVYATLLFKNRRFSDNGRIKLLELAGNSAGFNCLHQALVLKYYFGENPEVKLEIGVNNQGGFNAHAWVSQNGQIILGERKEENYLPLWQWN